MHGPLELRLDYRILQDYSLIRPSKFRYVVAADSRLINQTLHHATDRDRGSARVRLV